MAEIDISQELYKKITERFDELRFADKQTETLRQKLRTQAKGLTYKEGQIYSQRIGQHMSQALRETLTVDALPNQTLYYNIAQKTLGRAMYQDAELINEAAKNIQTVMNQAAGVGIKPVSVAVDEEAIHAVVQSASGLSAAEEIAVALDAPVVTHAMKVMDFAMKSNARFHHDSGMKIRVEREYDGVGLHNGTDACEWCLERAGKWTYEEALDNGVWERHEGCGCIITYETNKGEIVRLRG